MATRPHHLTGYGAMRSSGSNAVSADRVFVPDRFVISPGQPPTVDDAIYKLPLRLAYVTTAPPVVLGVLRSALDATIASASSKQSRLAAGLIWRDLTTVQLAIAHAHAVHHCTRAGLHSILTDLHNAAATSSEVPAELRATYWSTMALLYEEARDAVSRLGAAATSDAFMHNHGTAHAIRDIHVLTVAWEAARGTNQAAGAFLLGAKLTHPGF